MPRSWERHTKQHLSQNRNNVEARKLQHERLSELSNEVCVWTDAETVNVGKECLLV